MLDRFFRPRRDQHGSKAVDLNYVMKASQSIMSEILLERLLPKLLKMILEMTKATKGAIILAKETGLEIAAIGTFNQTIEISLRSLQLESSNLLPISVINYVAQTQQPICLSFAKKQGNFTPDPYIQENQVKTILCLPLLGKKNKLIAAIYLENNLFADAFEPQQINILKLMSIPAGLCIENAQLYKQLENYSSTLEDKIQELKRSEEVSRGQTAVLTNTLNVLTQEPELNKLIEIVLSAITVQLKAASSIVCLFNSKQDIISHYMSYLGNSVVTSPEHSQPSPNKTYYQVSKHPFWVRLINLAEPVSISVDPAEILDPDLYQSLKERKIKSLFVLPLSVGHQFLGLLGIHRTESKPLAAEQVELAAALAKQVSLAIKLTNLATKNRSAAVLEERNRLACEIHDTLAQTLTGISIQAGVAQRLVDQKPAAAKNLINQIGELAREGIIEARQSVWSLYPETLECNNFPEALSQLVAKMTTNTKIKTEINLQGTPIPLDSKVSLNLLRIGQEALTNSLKHSQAQNFWIELIFNQNRVLLKLRDDGQGFNLQQKTSYRGFGLIGMRQRAEQLGSELRIISLSGQGVEISVEVDLSIIQ